LTLTRDTVLEFRDVCFGYTANETLHNVSFCVQNGDFLAVVGPNGGGKTTLIKLALGLVRPQRGKVLLFGKNPRDTRKRVGYVPQIFMFDQTFPVRVKDVVRMGRIDCARWGFYRKIDDKAVDRALDEAEASELKHKPFSELSGGERQRVLLAQALVSRPELLLLDEPTANVDAVTEKRLYELFKKLNTGMTVFLISHNLNVVTRHANRVLCVNRTAGMHSTQDVSGSHISLPDNDMTLLTHSDNCPVTDSTVFLQTDHRAKTE
jgi:zinc transport system ATP-binding protein